jgi:hypothetical protein
MRFSHRAASKLLRQLDHPNTSSVEFESKEKALWNADSVNRVDLQPGAANP